MGDSNAGNCKNGKRRKIMLCFSYILEFYREYVLLIMTPVLNDLGSKARGTNFK